MDLKSWEHTAKNGSVAQDDKKIKNEWFFQNIYGSLYGPLSVQEGMLQKDMLKSILRILFFAGLTMI